MDKDVILRLEGVSKYFPGVKALDGVDFTVRTGEVHALVGENGAGKSTLVKVVTGVHQPTAGRILLRGEEVHFPTPQDSQHAGIAVIHQEATMFTNLSVLENIFMGHHLKRPGMGLVDWATMRERTESLLRQLEIEVDPETPVRDLSVAKRHQIEIVKALSFNADIVIMDEPTSALSLKEVEELYRIVRNLRDQGKAIVFISHKFDEIFTIADYFTVLRDGHYIGEGRVSESSVDEIVQMMVGRSLDQMFPKVEVPIGKPLLEVHRLSREGLFKDVSFTLHEGEILGFFGLVGAGRTEVMQAIFGIDTHYTGTIRVKGREVHIGSPREAMSLGLIYVPEDRQLQGVITEMSIRENTTLPILSRVSKLGFWKKREEQRITEQYGNQLQIRTSSFENLVESLSGGNQQKVVIAKWLATNPLILLMDEPTRGIDVATKAAVHRFIGELVEQRLGVILVSSELPEVLGMADNIVVMHEGKVTGRFSRHEANSENVIRAATEATKAVHAQPREA